MPMFLYTLKSFMSVLAKNVNAANGRPAASPPEFGYSRQCPIGQPAVGRCANPGIPADAPDWRVFGRISADSGGNLGFGLQFPRPATCGRIGVESRARANLPPAGPDGSRGVYNYQKRLTIFLKATFHDGTVTECCPGDEIGSGRARLFVGRKGQDGFSDPQVKLPWFDPWPPSTVTTVPLTKPARSEAMKTTTSATSSTLAARLAGRPDR